MRMWRRHMLFSTFVALIVMIVIQVYALGFGFESYGAWALYWLKNMLNVLRSNSSVGMIALGMTLVIITGGIDLAVGSTLAGVATVVMVCLDVSGRGFLTGAGITGTPNFLIAILAGLLTGAGLGALTGLGITKGRIPPFIITLGVMNIVRSVAQYFTKSYKPEVPKAFQVIANKEIIGDQMLLPILYWLALAAVMYVISRHTAFGRHIYAVGSNEKASRLSGINVNRVKMGVYMLMGVIVAIAAITSVARLRGVDVASAGSGFEMNAIAAVVVGGTSMAGGRGSILGTVFGVLIIGIMNNLLVLVGVDAFLSNAFTGAIIIFAVLIQKKDRG
ncbi:MAG: ABC transporter permease [Clostridia bacterium]|nr:ABC transporter permease [Clostridia bacterium]